MCQGARVRMIRCVAEEPHPPTGDEEREAWCGAGNSAIAVQTHVGDEGTVLWVNDDGTVCVAFDDGDERVLYPQEVSCLGPGTYWGRERCAC